VRLKRRRDHRQVQIAAHGLNISTAWTTTRHGRRWTAAALTSRAASGRSRWSDVGKFLRSESEVETVPISFLPRAAFSLI
jgi:hypothetical protein